MPDDYWSDHRERRWMAKHGMKPKAPKHRKDIGVGTPEERRLAAEAGYGQRLKTEGAGAFIKSMIPKAPKHRKMKPSRKDSGHLNDIRQLPCLLSGRPAEAAHIRYADAKWGKPETGMGQKPHDKYTVPLAPELHRLLKGCQHDEGEREWWSQFHVDPVEVALKLYGEPRIVMERIVAIYRPWRHSPAGQRVAAILKGAR